jgi:hypothetical protein
MLLTCKSVQGQEITLCISALAGAGQLGSSCSIPSSKRGAVMCKQQSELIFSPLRLRVALG